MATPKQNTEQEHTSSVSYPNGDLRENVREQPTASPTATRKQGNIECIGLLSFLFCGIGICILSVLGCLPSLGILRCLCAKSSLFTTSLDPSQSFELSCKFAEITPRSAWDQEFSSQQVRLVSVKAKRQWGGGGPPRRHVHDTIRPIRLTVALGLKTNK